MFKQPDWSALADEYASEHTSTKNQLCHLIGIPLIILALVRWTQWPPGYIFPWIALLLPVYYMWSIRLGLAMTVAIAVLAVIAYYFLNLWSALAVFILGWVFQFVGHAVFEKKLPSFLHNLIHLFVGPAWILQKLVNKTLGNVRLW